MGYGLVGFLLVLPAVLLGILVLILLGPIAAKGFVAFAVVTVAVVAWAVTVGIVVTALKSIFGVVLYLFAKTGKVPDGFETQDLRDAIAPA